MEKIHFKYILIFTKHFAKLVIICFRVNIICNKTIFELGLKVKSSYNNIFLIKEMLTSNFYGKVDENAIKMLNKNFNNLVY